MDEGKLENYLQEEEIEYFDLNHNDALVVSLRIINTRVKRVMIDIDSSTNIPLL